MVNTPSAMRETWVRFLGWEDPLEKGEATHSSILAWRIPWTVHRVTKSQTRLSFFHFTKPKQLITSMANILGSFMGHKLLSQCLINQCII